MSLHIDSFGSRDLASARAAEMLGAALRHTLEAQPTATLVVSGGSTPQACFQYLAQMALPWHRVLVTLSDERCVSAQHADSNERMVRKYLLTDRAAQAQFVDLQNVNEAPFAAVLLGMGADGHFASLFPDAANLDAGLDLNNPHATIEVTTAASPHRRVSMTLARLLNTAQLLLLAFGNDKRSVLEEPGAYPVGKLLQTQIEKHKTPGHPLVHILWAE